MTARGTKGRAGGGKRKAAPQQPRAARAAAPENAKAAPSVGEELDSEDEDEEAPGRRGRTDDGTAFMPDPGDGPATIDDSLAENLAEEFLESATRGEPAVDDVLEEIVPEEIGGPFLETTARDEFAGGTDAANPPDADREPLPRSGAGLIQTPREGEDEPGST